MASTRSRRTRRTTTTLSVAAICALALSSIPAAAAPAGGARPATPGPVAEGLAPSGNKISPAIQRRIDQRTARRQSVFVRLAGTGAADAARQAPGTARMAQNAAQARRAAVGRSADAVVAAATARDDGTQRLFEVTNAIPGIAVRANARAIRAIAARNDVVSVAPLGTYTLSNASSAQLTKAATAWRAQRNTGAGISIGIIDTGIDYTHSDFGGVGTTEAFDEADANEAAPGWRDSLPALARTKIAGGYDFVGNAYDANDPTSVPMPDDNPIDCNGHGTHVAGTSSGFGVNANGSTFRGNYQRLDANRLNGMRIGPGTAPRSTLYGLKVFGCEGSTNAVAAAIDWALDPNGDGNFSDHLDLINMSLGSDYSPPNDPLNDIVNEAASHGMLSVIAAGNNGDLTRTSGGPGNASSALTVASSVDAAQLRDGLRVDAPAGVAGIASGQTSVNYDWSQAPVSGSVVALSPDNEDGCAPLSAGDAAAVSGNVAWVEWNETPDGAIPCGSAVRANNVTAAGGVGAVFSSEVDQFSAGIAGNEDIPVFQLTGSETDRLRPALDAGTLEVTFDGDLIGTVKERTPGLSDTLSSFSSRGEHGNSGISTPHVAAPGDTITSAGVGTGNDQLTISGTSMATPHTAGIAAMVMKANPSWSVLQTKAAVMNTAISDVFTQNNRQGLRYGPLRVGSGRVVATRAIRTRFLAYSPNRAGGGSITFAPLAAPINGGPVVRQQRLRIENKSRKTRNVAISYSSAVHQPGASFSITPRSVRIRPGKARVVQVKMTVRPGLLRHTIDPTMATEQLGVPRQYVSDSSGRIIVSPQGAQAIRVPVVGTAKPASVTSASAENGQIVLSGAGVNQGNGSTAYRSWTSVMELGARSGNLPACTAVTTSGCTSNANQRGGDLSHVGAGSSDDLVWFGVASRGEWTDLGSWLEAFVETDTDGDGSADFVTFTLAAPGDLTSDVLTAYTVDLASGAVTDIQPVNFNWGDVDTNVFDSSAMVLPVTKAGLGLDDGDASTPISYQVGTFDYNGGGLLDLTDPIEYDAGTPDVATSGPLFLDRGGDAIDYQVADDAADAEALVLHLHGRPGARAEVVDVTP